MGMTDDLQQSFPFSQSLFLIPLTLEGYAGARPHRCTKVAIAGEHKNAFRQRFIVTGGNRKAAVALLKRIESASRSIRGGP
jgi:hypothetical protein